MLFPKQERTMTVQDTNNLSDKQRQWLKHIHASESAGQGMKAYAGQQGIDVKTLYHWKKILVKKGILPRTRKAKKQDPVFHRVRASPQPTSQWRIHLPNGLQIGLTGAVDEAALSIILKTAARLP